MPRTAKLIIAICRIVENTKSPKFPPLDLLISDRLQMAFAILFMDRATRVETDGPLPKSDIQIAMDVAD